MFLFNFCNKHKHLNSEQQFADHAVSLKGFEPTTLGTVKSGTVTTAYTSRPTVQSISIPHKIFYFKKRFNTKYH